MNLYLSALLYMMVQAVLFGVGTLIILATDLVEHAEILMPIMIGLTMLLAIPFSWILARVLRLSNSRVNHFARQIYVIDGHHKA